MLCASTKVIALNLKGVKNFFPIKKPLKILKCMRTLLRNTLQKNFEIFWKFVLKFYFSNIFLAQITYTWRPVFDQVLKELGGWPSLEGRGFHNDISVEKLYAIQVAKFRADSLFKATVQPDDKDSSSHILLVGSFLAANKKNISKREHVLDRSASAKLICPRFLYAIRNRRRKISL